MTGHKHRLVGQVQVYEDSTKHEKYFEANSPVQLVHEEHKSITIDPGIYMVVHEQEFDPFAKGLRRVSD